MARSLAEGWNNQGVRHLRVPALLNTLSVSFFWTIADFWTFSSVSFFWAPSLVQYWFLGFLLGMDSSVQRPWDLCTWSKSNLVIEFHPYPMPWHCYDTSISDEVLTKDCKPVGVQCCLRAWEAVCWVPARRELHQSLFEFSLLVENRVLTHTNSKASIKFTWTCQRLDRQAPPADGMASRSAWLPPPGANTLLIISMVEEGIVLDYM